jgi:hypothetical protein
LVQVRSAVIADFPSGEVITAFVEAALLRAGVLKQSFELVQVDPFGALTGAFTGRAGLVGWICAAFEVVEDSGSDIGFPVAQVAAGEDLDFHELLSLKKKIPPGIKAGWWLVVVIRMGLDDWNFYRFASFWFDDWLWLYHKGEREGLCAWATSPHVHF